MYEKEQQLALSLHHPAKLIHWLITATVHLNLLHIAKLGPDPTIKGSWQAIRVQIP